MTSGSQDTSAPETVPAQAATETDFDMPIGSSADENRQVPRSGEGEGAVGDTAGEPDTGQSATVAPRKEQ